MLPSNVETEVREILEKNGGWLRVEKCAKLYARDPYTGKIDRTKRTNFYRWRRKIEKGKVEGFQILRIPGNIVYIGLKGADPNKVLSSIISDEETSKKMRGFFGRFKRKKEQKELFTYGESVALSHFLQHDTQYMRNFSKLYIWLKRGAKPEEKPELEE